MSPAFDRFNCSSKNPSGVGNLQNEVLMSSTSSSLQSKLYLAVIDERGSDEVELLAKMCFSKLNVV